MSIVCLMHTVRLMQSVFSPLFIGLTLMLFEFTGLAGSSPTAIRFTDESETSAVPLFNAPPIQISKAAPRATLRPVGPLDDLNELQRASRRLPAREIASFQETPVQFTPVQFNGCYRFINLFSSHLLIDELGLDRSDTSRRPSSNESESCRQRCHSPAMPYEVRYCSRVIAMGGKNEHHSGHRTQQKNRSLQFAGQVNLSGRGRRDWAAEIARVPVREPGLLERTSPHESFSPQMEQKRTSVWPRVVQVKPARQSWSSYGEQRLLFCSHIRSKRFCGHRISPKFTRSPRIRGGNCEPVVTLVLPSLSDENRDWLVS